MGVAFLFKNHRPYGRCYDVPGLCPCDILINLFSKIIALMDNAVMCRDFAPVRNHRKPFC
jgi:hypothetical protein